MNKRFAVIVQSHPYTQTGAMSALDFIQSLKHPQLSGVFFYGDGVHIALQSEPPQDEINVQHAWLAWAKRQNNTLPICVATAARRGIHTVQSPFKLIGLTEFFQRCSDDTTLIYF